MRDADRWKAFARVWCAIKKMSLYCLAFNRKPVAEAWDDARMLVMRQKHLQLNILNGSPLCLMASACAPVR